MHNTPTISSPSKNNPILVQNPPKPHTPHHYSFNGMEKDDEVKGANNSLDFGARIYDARIGRWLARDPMSVKQPGWSPYKSFLDNPIYWVDPDGKIEYEVVKITDAKTGKSIEMKQPVSYNIMTDVSSTPNGLQIARYYDFERVTEYIIKEDGSKTVIESINILTEGPVRDVEWNWFVHDDWGDVKFDLDSWINSQLKGGIIFKSANGQGGETKSALVPVESMNIDDLMGLLGLAGGNRGSGAGSFNIPEKFRDPDGLMQALEILTNVISKQEGTMTNIKDIIQGVKDVRKEMGIKDNRVIHCKACNGNYKMKDDRTLGEPTNVPASDTVDTHGQKAPTAAQKLETKK